MMTKKKKILVLCVVLIIGIILGGAGASYFLRDIYSHFIIIQNQTSTRRAIIIPYAILVHLRKNHIKTAIECLEIELDSGLFSLAYEKNYVAKNDKVDDETDRIMLKKIREYRNKYPRKNKVPGSEKAINSLLFPNQHNNEPNTAIK